MQTEPINNTTSNAAENDEFELDVQVITFDTEKHHGPNGPIGPTATQATAHPLTGGHTTTITGNR